MEYKYEEWIESQVYRYRGEHNRHRLARVARRTNHIVHTQVEVHRDITPKDNTHKILGVGESFGRGFTSTKEHQNLVQEGEHHRHYRKTDNDIQDYGIAESLLGSRLVALAQAQRSARQVRSLPRSVCFA